jgi:tRNA threonylcarbamoyladenosine biosynthesis protein TsaE
VKALDGVPEPVADYRQWLADEPAMLAFAARCSTFLRAGGLVFLEGDLGAGKTTFARGLLRALGYQGAVKSPTYTLMESYQVSGTAIYHCDLYRLADPEELEFLGLRELFDSGALWLIEWPERGMGWLPAPDLVIALTWHEHGRYAVLRATSARAQAWLVDLRN